jgi:hypothetical protein
MLDMTLPSSRAVHEWRLTWVGFDALLIAALTATALLAWRRHRSVILYAHATAVLLICDTWFDISLDAGTGDVWISGGLALLAELPLAALLIRRAHLLIALLPFPGAAGRRPVVEQGNGWPPGAATRNCESCCCGCSTSASAPMRGTC